MPEEAAPELTESSVLPSNGQGSSPREGLTLPGIPVLQVDASVMRAHHRVLVGAVVRGELHGLPVLELDVLAIPKGQPWPGPPEAEWRALLLALHVAREQRRHRGPLEVLTDATASVELWRMAQETDALLGAPPEAWREGVTLTWVPRKRVAEADRALRTWMQFLVPSLLGDNMRDLAAALGTTRVERMRGPFRVRLSLQGGEVAMWAEGGLPARLFLATPAIPGRGSRCDRPASPHPRDLGRDPCVATRALPPEEAAE